MFRSGFRGLNRRWKWMFAVIGLLYFLPLLSHVLLLFMPTENLSTYFKEKGIAVSEHHITKPQGQIHYYKLGGDTGQWVLWVHGSPGSAADVREQAAMSVSQGFRVLLLDRPGYGGSALSESALLTNQAQALIDILQEEVSGQQCILAAHSYGGAVVLRAASLKHNRVKGLLLVSPTLDPDLERNNGFKRFLQAYGLSWPIRWMLPHELLQSAREMALLPSEMEKTMPDLEQVRCPIAEIHGTNDALAPFGNQAFVRKHLRFARRYFLTYKDGDHFIVWKYPEAVQAMLKKL